MRRSYAWASVMAAEAFSQRTDVLVVAALETEIAALRTRRHAFESCGRLKIWRTRTAGEPVLAVTGMGRRSTLSNLERALERVQPQRVIMIGLAGACRETLSPGALVFPSRFVLDLSADFGAVCGAPFDPIEARPIESALIEQLGARASFPVHRGVLVTTNVIATPGAKASLGRNLGALACDMESYWAARLARERGVEMQVVRVIFDACSERLPAIDPETATRTLLRRPWLALRLAPLGLRLLRCKKALREAVDALIQAG